LFCGGGRAALWFGGAGSPFGRGGSAPLKKNLRGDGGAPTKGGAIFPGGLGTADPNVRGTEKKPNRQQGADGPDPKTGRPVGTFFVWEKFGRDFGKKKTGTGPV